MQISLNEISELLAERTGRQFDIAFREEVKVMVNYWRARLIVDSLNSRPQDRQFFSKWIDMPLIKTNTSDFPGFPNCNILKTVCPIPSPVRANSMMFDFIGKLDKASVIPLSTPYLIKPLAFSKYTGNIPRAAYINDHIYVFGTLNLPGIAVNMIPEDIGGFLNCCKDCNSICEDDNSAYGVSMDLKQRIVQAILGTELKGQVPQAIEAQEVPISNG